MKVWKKKKRRFLFILLTCLFHVFIFIEWEAAHCSAVLDCRWARSASNSCRLFFLVNRRRPSSVLESFCCSFYQSSKYHNFMRFFLFCFHFSAWNFLGFFFDIRFCILLFKFDLFVCTFCCLLLLLHFVYNKYININKLQNTMGINFINTTHSLVYKPKNSWHSFEIASQFKIALSSKSVTTKRSQ